LDRIQNILNNMGTRNGNRSMNSFAGGMNLDLDNSVLADNQYRYAENIRTIGDDTSSNGTATNIEGALLISSIIPSDEIIIGTCTVRDFGVVFTRVTSNGRNKIYKVTFDDPNNPIAINVLNQNPESGPLGIDLGISDDAVIKTVGRYEDSDNIKVYFADGENYIRVINIAIEDSLVDYAGAFDIVPTASLEAPSIQSIGTGRLDSGVIQYYYQLTSETGASTALSPSSPIVHLTDSSVSEKDIDYTGTGLGDIYGKPSGKSVKLKINLDPSNKYTKIKLISVYYYNYNEIPVISVVKDMSISSIEDNTVYIDDGGTTVLKEMSVSEFNLIGGNLFIPNYIESKDNILFAGNIKESTWDIPSPGEPGYYDTRSYQFKQADSSSVTSEEGAIENDTSIEIIEIKNNITTHTGFNRITESLSIDVKENNPILTVEESGDEDATSYSSIETVIEDNGSDPTIKIEEDRASGDTYFIVSSLDGGITAYNRSINFAYKYYKEDGTTAIKQATAMLPSGVSSWRVQITAIDMAPPPDGYNINIVKKRKLVVTPPAVSNINTNYRFTIDEIDAIQEIEEVVVLSGASTNVEFIYWGNPDSFSVLKIGSSSSSKYTVTIQHAANQDMQFEIRLIDKSKYESIPPTDTFPDVRYVPISIPAGSLSASVNHVPWVPAVAQLLPISGYNIVTATAQISAPISSDQHYIIFPYADYSPPLYNRLTGEGWIYKEGGGAQNESIGEINSMNTRFGYPNSTPITALELQIPIPAGQTLVTKEYLSFPNFTYSDIGLSNNGDGFTVKYGYVSIDRPVPFESTISVRNNVASLDYTFTINANETISNYEYSDQQNFNIFGVDPTIISESRLDTNEIFLTTQSSIGTKDISYFYTFEDRFGVSSPYEIKLRAGTSESDHISIYGDSITSSNLISSTHESDLSYIEYTLDAIRSTDTIISTILYIEDVIYDQFDTIILAGNISAQTRVFNKPNGYSSYSSSSGAYVATIHKADNSTPFVFSYSGITDVPSDHDAIHKEIYEKERYADIEHRYNKDGVLGGSGINVDYVYTNTYFIESYGHFWGDEPGISKIDNNIDFFIDRRTARIGDVKRSDISKLIFSNSDGSNEVIPLSYFNIGTQDGSINYSNPLLSNNFKSYQRDEIYRFAAVFYDTKGRRSPAHWIADIRFPAGYVESTGWDSSIFEMPYEEFDKYSSSSNQDFVLEYDSLYKEQELLVKPIGVKFTFKNLNNLSGVSRIEIVRAKRDINNKTIYSSGTIQKVGTYSTEYSGSSFPDKTALSDLGPGFTLRPHPVMSMGYSYGVAPLFYNMVITDSLGRLGAITNQVENDMSPDYFNRNYLMFSSPETSYYGIDFYSQLSDSIGSIGIDIVDCIFPLTTPNVAFIYDNLVQLGTYSGNTLMERSIRKPIADYYADGVMACADINVNSKKVWLSDTGSDILDSIGYTGKMHEGYNGSVEQTISYGFNPTSTSASADIKGSFSRERSNTLISLGGIFIDDGEGNSSYSSGFSGGLNRVDSDPASFSDVANKNRLNAGVFKYYNRFSRKKSQGVDLGGLELVMQTGENTSDIRISSIFSLDVSSSIFDKLFFKATDSEFAPEIKYNEPIRNVSPDPTIVGGNLFINYSTHFNETIYNSYSDNGIGYGKGFRSGPHAAGIVMYFNGEPEIPSIDRIYYHGRATIEDSPSPFKRFSEDTYIDKFRYAARLAERGLATFSVNIKKMNSAIYGGAAIVDKQFTEYISTGMSLPISNSDTVKEFVSFGGDTFIGIYDHSILRYEDPHSPATSNKKSRESVILNQKGYIGALIPTESSINLHLANSKSFVASNYNNQIWDEVGVHGAAISQGIDFSISQETPQYEYNAAYSAEITAIGFMPLLLSSESNKSFDCRIYNSDAKTNDEIFDSWAMFRPANYIDVDTEHGQLTGLYNFNNKLFFWQKNSFGVLSVNERSLITDNNIGALSLGTSGILSRFDYITTSNGFKYKTINGISNSDTALYWYDGTNNEFCGYNGDVASVSKIKGIQSVLNKSKDSIQNNIPIVFDKKYNEVILSIYGLSNAIDIN